MRRSRRVFRRFKFNEAKPDRKDSLHEFFVHHTEEELQKSALSCHLCFLLLDISKDHNFGDASVGDPIVPYLEVRQKFRGMRLYIFYVLVRKNPSDQLVKLKLVASTNVYLQQFSGTIPKYEVFVAALLTCSGDTTVPIQSGQTVLMDRVARCAARIRSWITTCESSHPDCQGKRIANAAKDDLPRRLLHLSFCNGAPRAVVDNTAGLQSDTKYTTLSHRWGDVQIIRLLLNNE